MYGARLIRRPQVVNLAVDTWRAAFDPRRTIAWGMARTQGSRYPGPLRRTTAPTERKLRVFLFDSMQPPRLLV